MSKTVRSDLNSVMKRRKFFENDESLVGGLEELEVAQNSNSFTQDIAQDHRGSISNQSRREHDARRS